MAQSGMNSKKKFVLTALTAGESVPAAAESAGVGIRTVYNWLRDDEEFKAALDAVQSVMVDRLLIDLMLVQRLAAPAVPGDVLRAIHRHYNLSQVQIEKIGAVLRGEL